MKDKVVDGKTLIVKYSNRKLYNRVASKYVTLDEILALGVGNFVVIDNLTKQDITSEVLLLALFKEYKDNPTELVAIINYGRSIFKNAKEALNE